MKSEVAAKEVCQVQATESVVRIPTYGPLGHDPWPHVFFKSQWFSPLYPLDRFIHPAGSRHEQEWTAVTLENEYLRVVVLPQLGGHVWEMYDKVSKQHLVYNNDVIRPTRIGFRTGWCAIGMEFNFPVAHSLQSLDPLPYRIEHHDDGSASVLTWHRDRPRRIEMILSLTLRPGRRDLQVRAEMYNPSAVRRPYDYWTNTAVSARPATQFVYPTRWMQSHGGRKVYSWPIVNGEDMRFQTNYMRTVSFFAWDRESQFFGCWWSDTDTGLAHVADPACCPGKKLFNWGKRAEAWLAAVTDKSGPYAELQAGRFATQADYQWLWPGQKDVLEETWYGYHKLGGLSWAGKDLAMHVRADGEPGTLVSSVAIRLHSVEDVCAATVTVKVDGRVAWSSKIDLLAVEPARLSVALPAAARESVTVEVAGAAGTALGAYTLSLQAPSKTHKPTVGPEKWEGMFADLEGKSAKECARIGQIGELHNLWLRAAEGYESALKADPSCKEALTGQAFVALRHAKPAEAAQLAQRLLDTRSRKWAATGAYLLGAARLQEGRADEAVEILKKATKDDKVGPVAQLFLAMAMARLGRMAEAILAAESVPEPVASMPVAQWVRAAVKGDTWAADPASGWSIADAGELFDLGCERALWAIRIGMPSLGQQIVGNMLARAEDLRAEPLVWYLKAYLEHLQGKDEVASASLQKAAGLLRSSRWPGQPEWRDVLGWTLAASPSDVRPHAYLAPLEYWLAQPEKAVEHWRNLIGANGDKDAAGHYSLAMALWEMGGGQQPAAEILMEALEAHPDYERLYLVLDDLLVEAQQTEARGQWLDKARQNIGQTDALVERYCHWLVNQQRWGEVVETLRQHKFGPAHGLYLRRRMWLLSHHMLARQRLEQGDHSKAYEYGVAGARPPISMGEDDMTMPFASPVLLVAAEAAEKMGDRKKARELCMEAVELAKRGNMHPPYTEIHRARALLKLGKKAAAQKILAEVQTNVQRWLDDARPGLNKGHFHYLYGLLLETQGKQEEAEKHFREAETLKMHWANLVGHGVQWGFN